MDSHLLSAYGSSLNSLRDRIMLERRHFYIDSKFVLIACNSARMTALILSQIGEVVTTIPTIGFNVESVSYKNLNFNVWVKHLYAKRISSQNLAYKLLLNRTWVAKHPSGLTGGVIMRTRRLSYLSSIPQILIALAQLLKNWQRC